MEQKAVWRALLAALAVTASHPAGAVAIQKNAAPAGLAKSPALPVLEEKVPGFMIKPKARGGEKVAAALTAKDAAELSVRANIGLRVHRAMSGGAHVLRLDKPVPLSAARAIATRMMRGGDIELVEPDRIARPFAEPLDPIYVSNQWNLKAPAGLNVGGANLPNAWDFTLGSSAAVVAVLDTGILPHVDINWSTVLTGYDFIGNFSNFNAPRSTDGNGRDANAEDSGDFVTSQDFCFDPDVPENNRSSWHGTHVSGIIGASWNNGTGIAGIAPQSRILPVRVLGTCGGLFSDIIDGMRWAAGLPVGGLNNSTPAKILNLSLGAKSGACGQSLQAAVTDVINVGASIVAATGNDNVIGVPQPANCDGVIAVTAHALDGDTTNYANIGVETTISAPGGGCGEAKSNLGQCTEATAPAIASTIDSAATTPSSGAASSYGLYAGTSMAAPHVAGVAALMLAQDATLVPAQIKSYLQAAARDFPNGSACVTRAAYQGKCGAGLLDAERSLAILAEKLPYFTDISANAVVAPNTAVTLSGTALAVSPKSISSYQWTQVSGPSVPLSNAATASASFVAPSTGVLTFQLTATDSDGKTASATVIIRVNSPPMATQAPNQTVTVGQNVSLTLEASDPDGDAFVFEPTSLPAGATLSPDGIFSWPNASPAGSYTIAYFVRDIDSASQSSFTIAVQEKRSGGGGGSVDGLSLAGLSLAALALRLRRFRRHRRARG